MAALTRLTGDLDRAEDAVQDACEAALVAWARDGVPANPGGWLVATARHKATDRLRREARRPDKEAAAVRDLTGPEPTPTPAGEDDDLALVFLCCHPALGREARIALTLRCVCGLSTEEIAAAFLLPPATMAKRLVRAKQKISRAGIPFRTPTAEELPQRLPDVLRVAYLAFTTGHRSPTGPGLVRTDLCDTALALARGLAARLPDEPEATGLLALLLLTDARRAARTDPEGALVLLEDQDRARWDRAAITEGDALLVAAARHRRPGPYQLWAAIAACHATAPTAADTDWRQISLLYGELIRHEPTPVVEANRAVAVAMAEGPAAGLVILDTIAVDPTLDRWSPFHLARADLLRRLDRLEEAAAAYRLALQLEPPPAERAFIARRLRELGSSSG